jgi:hypothetical protein
LTVGFFCRLQQNEITSIDGHIEPFVPENDRGYWGFTLGHFSKLKKFVVPAQLETQVGSSSIN